MGIELERLMDSDEFREYRERYIARASQRFSKNEVKKFIKACDRSFPISDVVEYRLGGKVVIREGDEDVLYAHSGQTDNFYRIGIVGGI